MLMIGDANRGKKRNQNNISCCVASWDFWHLFFKNSGIYSIDVSLLNSLVQYLCRVFRVVP
jgi:hypothetical protein